MDYRHPTTYVGYYSMMFISMMDIDIYATPYPKNELSYPGSSQQLVGPKLRSGGHQLSGYSRA